MSAGTHSSAQSLEAGTGRRFLVPLILTTALFCLWGFSYGLLDVLNKHFQDILQISKAKSTVIQFAYFGAYATIVWPAGWLMERLGYQKSIVFGLVLFTIGAFLFIPSANSMNFTYFAISLFVLASGLVTVESAASPYVSVLGPPEKADHRIAIAQCVFGLGAFFGPVVGGTIFFGLETSPDAAVAAVKTTYTVTGCVVLAFAIAYGLKRLPQPDAPYARVSQEEDNSAHVPKESLLAHRHFKWAVLAQWLNVGAQVGIGALFINYVTENWPNIEAQDAAYLLSVGMAMFVAGRFVSTAMLGKLATHIVLSIFAGMNVIFMLIAALNIPQLSSLALVGALFGCGGTYSFIFALGLRGLGEARKRGAAALVFGVSGGAIIPPIMGLVADRVGTSLSYIVPMACYGFVLLFAMKLYKRAD